jgi:hypothetical protein
MVADTAGIAHAACGNDDMKAGELRDRLALVHGFRKSKMWRIEQAAGFDIVIQARSVLAKHLGCADCERRIQKNRRGGDFSALHQADEVDDQFLGSFHRECRDQQGAVRGGGIANLSSEALSPLLRRDRLTHPVAIG